MRYWYSSIHGSLLKVKSGLKNSLLIRGIYTSGQVTCNGSTTLQDHMRHVLQHSHGRTTHTRTKAKIILRPSKFVQHCYELTQRCAMLCDCSWDPVQRFESPSVASEFWTCSKFRGDLNRPFCRIKQMRCIVQRKRQDVRIAKFAIAKCFKAVGSQLWQGLKHNKISQINYKFILCIWNEPFLLLVTTGVLFTRHINWRRLALCQQDKGHNWPMLFCKFVRIACIHFSCNLGQIRQPNPFRYEALRCSSTTCVKHLPCWVQNTEENYPA